MNDPQHSNEKTRSQDYTAAKKSERRLSSGNDGALGVGAAVIVIVMGIASGSDRSFFKTQVIGFGIAMVVAIATNRYWFFASYIVTFVFLFICASTICGI